MVLARCALLCGSAPVDYQQAKLVAVHDFLVSKAGGAWREQEMLVFPNGVHELVLESALNGAFDAAAEEDGSEVLLYLCAVTEADLHAELSDSACAGVEVVRLGSDEVRTDVIAYYAELAARLEIGFRVVYEADSDFVSEEALGYENISREKCVC